MQGCSVKKKDRIIRLENDFEEKKYASGSRVASGNLRPDLALDRHPIPVLLDEWMDGLSGPGCGQ